MKRFTCLFPFFVALILIHSPLFALRARWEGSSVDLPVSGSRTATLVIMGNFGGAGYVVDLVSRNPIGPRRAALKLNGISGASVPQLRYRAELDMSQVRARARVDRARLNLRNPTRDDIRVSFRRGDHQPTNARRAHRIALTFTLDPFSPIEVAAGDYSDWIDAEITVR